MDKKTIVTFLFNYINQRYNYAILHHLDNIFEDDKDIDFVINCKNKKQLYNLVKSFVKDTEGVYILNFYKIDYKIYRIDLAYIQDNNFILIELDVSILQKGYDLLCINSEKILKNKELVVLNENSFYKASSQEEYEYYISKKAFKNDCLDNFIAYLQGILPNKSKVEIQNDFLAKKKYYSSLSFKLKYLINKGNLFTHRIWRNQRLTIAFLGPDGSGKTTVINSLKDKNICRKTHSYHLKPIRKESKNPTNSNPHIQKEYTKILSFIKLIYFVLQYNFWWLVNIFKLRLSSTLVIFDRYYFDIYGDPKRYRYSGSKRIIKFFGKFIPKPDLTFVLYTDANVIYNRKKEVEFSELEKQLNSYKELSVLKHTFLVDADKPIDEICIKLIKHIAINRNDKYHQ